MSPPSARSSDQRFGQPLPVEAVLDELCATLRSSHALLQAPTGSGKSTRVPLALLNQDWLAGQRLLLLEPRRAAARLTAARMADLLGEALGETVGYQVRFERHLGPGTRIEVLTEGLLTRRLQADPTLAGVGAILFDEFHEQNLEATLGLALTLDVVAGLRPELRILAMSATLDAAPLQALLGGAPLILAAGRSYPVTIRYAAQDPGVDWLPAMASTIREALAQQPGDVLAFLPGAREIGQLAARLAEGLVRNGQVAPAVEILPLHGTLSLVEQERVLKPPPVTDRVANQDNADRDEVDGSGSSEGDEPGGQPGEEAPQPHPGHPDMKQRPASHRRIILATDLAETSLTIPGIGAVVDSGLTRKPRFSPASGLTRLVTQPIPLASADQRAGRAGRLGPGVCYRLWTPAREVGRPAHRTPEILQSDLAGLALELALWGVRDPGELRWLQAPPRPAWEQAITLLRRLEALDAAGHITPLGRAMTGLPLHPRLAALLLGAPPHLAGTAVDLCALLSERDPHLRRPGAPVTADLECRLIALAAWRARGETTSSDHDPAAGHKAARSERAYLPHPARAIHPFPNPDGGQLAGKERHIINRERQLTPADRTGDWPGENDMDPRRLAAVDRAAAQLHRLLRGLAGAQRPGVTSPGGLLALAYPDRIAQRRNDRESRYRLAQGTGAVLPAGDALAVHPYLVVARLDATGREGQIQLALPITAEELLAVGKHQLRRERVLTWDPGREAASAQEIVRFETLTLSTRPVPFQASDPVQELLLARITRDHVQTLPWSTEARQLQARVELLRGLEPALGWPDLSDSRLEEELSGWLAPWLAGKSRLAEVRDLDLAVVLAARLDWPQRQRLDQEAPTHLITPAGTRRPIDYLAGDTPLLAVPLQEMLGSRETPRIAGGRVALLVQLLSPARRPIQLTRDLPGFWAGSYAEVRKEMRGRYPKHHWPEDPATASPLARSLKSRPPRGERD